MWKPLHQQYFYTFRAEAGTHEYYIGVTDLRKYWSTNTTRKSFLADLKESNEGLEFDDEDELLKWGLDMFSNPEDLQKVSVKQDEEGKFLSVSISKKYEITLKLQIRLIEASVDDFFYAIIRPLLKTVCDLRSSQRELRDLLIKKDKEIEEYKIEGKAPRRLITTVYDDAAHMKKHTTYEEYFSAPKVLELLEATASTSSTRRKRPPPSKIDIKDEIKKFSQEAVTEPITPSHIKVEVQTPEQEEVKIKKQRKPRLKY